MTNYEQPSSIIEVNAITKHYLGMRALSNVWLDIEQNKLTVITGPSGSGKTTLLNILSGIDLPDAGSVIIDGIDITQLSKKERETFRASTGQVFQRSGLLRGLTAEENIRMPHDLTGKSVDEDWTQNLVDSLAISDFLKKPASQLSGGQAQRVGIVRALAHHPRYIFADEPTASLDTQAKADVHELFRGLVDDGVTILMVSHDELSNDYADRNIKLKDGKINNVPN